MGTGVEIPLAEELIGAEIIGETVGSAALGDFAGTSLAADIGGSLGFGGTGFGIGEAGIGSFLGDYGVGSFLGDYGLGSLASSLGEYGGLGITDATGVSNLSNVVGPTGGLNSPFGYGNVLSTPSGIYATQPGQLLSSIQGVQGLQGVGANLITPTKEALLESSLASAGTDYASIPMTQSQIEATNAFNVFDPTQETALGIPVDEAGGNVPDIREQVLSGRVPVETTKPGILENLKTVFDPTSSTSAMDRLSALGDVGSQAFKSMFLTKDGSLNYPAVFGALSFYPSYAAAKQKANEIGVPFNETLYQAGKVAPFKEKYATMAPKSAFGITTAATGGRIGFDSGGPGNKNEPPKPKPKIDLNLLAMSLYGVPFDQLTSTQKDGLFELADTQKAKGGRIGYETGDLVIPEGGPGNKKIQEQMMRAAKKAQEEYLKRKAQEQLMDKNYKEQSMYDFKKSQKELFDAANENEFPPLPEPVKPKGVLSIKLTPVQGKKKGGKIVPREKHFLGNLIKGSGVVDAVSSDGPIPIGLLNNTGGGFGNLIKQLINQNPELTQKQPYVPSNRPVNDLYQYYLNNDNDEEKRQTILKQVMPLFGVNKADGGMINHPVRMLQGGIPELDLRAKGGFIPYGVKEKADDVPAMLSKNEFVFTADAVKNAGNGSINKGAQKMYKLMKSLENKKIKKRVA